MFDDFAPRLADILTTYSTPIQRGDLVGIFANTSAEPLVKALYEAVLRRGGNPTVFVRLPGLEELFYKIASDEQLDYLNPILLDIIEKLDVMFQILAPENTKRLASIDPARIARHQQARQPFVRRYFERCDDQSLRWNITAWPTEAAAQEAEMNLLDYTEFMYKACGLDQPDPIAYWQALKSRQQKLVDWLNGKKHVQVKGPGIDLSFSVEGRNWVNCWGNNNFPDGEIFTSPVDDSVNGTVAFSYPTFYTGREVSGVRLAFKDGVPIEASAEKGQDDLLQKLDLDESARRLGEFAIGTNRGIQQFTGETLFDEKIGGTIHMALGQSIAEAGGVNQSQIHWDFVHAMRDGGEITIDGELLYKNGDFTVDLD